MTDGRQSGRQRLEKEKKRGVAREGEKGNGGFEKASRGVERKEKQRGNQTEDGEVNKQVQGNPSAPFQAAS